MRSIRLRLAALCCLLPTLLLLTPSNPALAATITDCPASEAALITDIGNAGPGGTVLFSCNTSIILTSTIPISTNLTLDGNGHAVTIDGNSAVGVFAVNSSSVTFTMRGLTIAHGSASNGGGIFNNGGTVIVSNSTFSGNSAANGNGISSGGAIDNEGGTLTVTNSTFSSNVANGAVGIGAFGGAINNTGTLTVTNSTFSSNSASGGFGGAFGGGIFNGGTATVTNSTFSGNSATNGGGGIESVGTTLNVTNSTFSGNSATQSGGGIRTTSTTNFTNTIMANSPSGGNCTGPITDNGGNVEYPTNNTCGFSVPNGDSFGNPNLGNLANNGGPTQTLALGAGSSAIGLGLIAVCNSTGPTGVNGLDQRGFPRPTTGSCDSGAFDTFSQSAILTGSPNPAGIGQPVTYTAAFHLPAALLNVGTVTFADSFNGSTSPLAIVVIVNGVATFTTSYTEAQLGTHSITATYNGGTSGNVTVPVTVSNTIQEMVQGCQILASVVVPHARLGVAASPKGSIQYITLEENGGSLTVLRPLTILTCSGLGTASAQVSVQGMASKVRAMPGVGAGPIRVTFQFGAGGVVTEVDVQDTTSGTHFVLPAPFLFGTGIHLFTQ